MFLQKQFHVLISFAFLVALVVPTAKAQFQLLDDLSDETIGLIDGQDGWVSNGGDNAVVLDPADASNQCLCVPSASSVLSKALSAAGLTLPDGTSRMFFFRMRVAHRQTFSVGVSPFGSPKEYDDFAPELGMASSVPNLELRAWDDDGGMYEVLRDLEADIWYNVWVRIDTALNHYEVWVNDATGASASPADHLAAPDGDQTFHFRTGDASELRAFFIKTSGGSSGFGPVYFDDLYLESTANLSLCNPTNLVLGDCNCDGAVNLADLGILLASFGLCSVDPGFASNADVNGDGCVDLQDLALLLAAYGT